MSFNIFMSTAGASEQKVTPKADAASFAAFLALIVAAVAGYNEAKNIAIGALVVAALFGAAAVAYAEELPKVIGFSCEKEGYLLKMKDGSILHTAVKDGTGEVSLYKQMKDGTKEPMPLNDRIKAVAPTVKGACLVGNLSPDEIKAVIDKANSNLSEGFTGSGAGAR